MLQVWPIHTTIKAVQHAHRFHEIFDDLLGNASLPSISSFYFETYRLWILVPILTVMLTLICSHRRISTATLPIIAAALTILLTYVMNQIMTEAIYAPFRTITTSLGK